MAKEKKFPCVERTMVDAEGNKSKLTIRQLVEVMAGANRYHERAKFLFAQRHNLNYQAVHTALQRGREIEEAGGASLRQIDFLLWAIFNKEIEENGGNVRAYVRSKVENPREVDTAMMRYARDEWDKPVDYQLDKYWALLEGKRIEIRKKVLVSTC